MKIYDGKRQVVFEGKFNSEMLDLQQANNQGDHLLVCVKSPEIEFQTKDIAWDYAESHDWISIDSDKTRTYFYIELDSGDIDLQIESYPYLLTDSDIEKELDGMDDEERQSVEGYYQEVEDWYDKNTCGEFDCIDVEFDEDELDMLNKALCIE